MPAVLRPQAERDGVDAGAWITEGLEKDVGPAQDKVGQSWEYVHAPIPSGKPAIEENGVRAGAEAEQVAAACDLQAFDDLDVPLGARLIERRGLPERHDAWDVIFRAGAVGRDLGIALAILHAHVIHQVRAKPR